MTNNANQPFLTFEERLEKLGLSDYYKVLWKFTDYVADAESRKPVVTWADMQRRDAEYAVQLEQLRTTGNKKAYIAYLKKTEAEFPSSKSFYVNTFEDLQACTTWFAQRPYPIDNVRDIAQMAQQFRTLPGETKQCIGFDFTVTNDIRGIPAAVVFKRQGLWRFMRSYLHSPTALFEDWSVETIVRFNDERLQWLALKYSATT